MPVHPTTAVAELSLPDDVRAFCRRHDLVDHLRRAIEIARQTFSIVGEPEVRLEQDPEDGDSYLVLGIRVRGDEGECIQAQKSFGRSWANSTDLPEVHMISLVCERAED
jgi:hypothetical protein